MKVSTTIDSVLGVVSRLDSTDSLTALTVSDATFSGNVALGSDSLDTVTVNGAMAAIDSAVKLRDIQELTTPLTGATGATTHDASLARVFVHSSLAGAFTANFTNVGLTSGYATTLTLVLQQGATPRLPTMGTIDGTVVTFSWQGNITPVATANRTDIVTFSVILSGATYLVYGQLVSF